MNSWLRLLAGIVPTVMVFSCASLFQTKTASRETISTESGSTGYKRYAKARITEEAAESESTAAEESENLQDLPPSPGQRKVIYVARLSLEVPTLPELVSSIEIYARSQGGFVEQTYIGEERAQVTVRIPVESFHKAVEELSQKGRLLDRDISAADVTKEYQDTEIRLANDKAVRERLYLLLQNEKDVNEKIRILREIERLNQAIDAAALRLKLLAERAAYSTIICELQLLQSDKPIQLPSPFGWIAALKPTERSIEEYRYIRLPVPEKFFSYEKAYKKRESSALYISPAQAMVRAGRVENEPKADLNFCKTALLKEFLSRGYETEAEQNSSSQILAFRIKEGLSTRYYAVALFVTEKSVFVIEAWYPNEETRNELHGLVAKSISEVKIDE